MCLLLFVICYEINRWHSTTKEDMDVIKDWKNLDRIVKEKLRKNFPSNWIKCGGKTITLTYSALKSDGKLLLPQQMHCDAKQEWVYSTGKITKFPFSIIIGVEDMSFIDFVMERNKGEVR